MPRHAPFRAGDPKNKELGRLGGKISTEVRRAKANADPLTRGLLGELLGYTTDQWMQRLGLTSPSWDAWRIIGRVIDGFPLVGDDMTTYTTLSGRSVLPDDLREVWAIAGRGSGKTSFMALQAARYACRAYPGIRGIPRILLLAFVKEQAGVLFDYVSEFFDKDRELRKLIVGRTRSTLTLAHGVRIQTISANFRQVRAYSVAAAVCDEIAFWWNDVTNANPDQEIVRALRPALGKVPGSRLLVASTPFTEEGQLYDVHQRHYANDDSRHILVVRAPTTVLNPSFDAARISIEEQEDPESAASEFGAAWRVAGGTLIRPEVYDSAVDKGVVERAPVPPLGDDHYIAAVDLSGGTGQDSAALSIQHVEVDDDATGAGGACCVQDILREWLPPFDPGVMCGEIALECTRFGITEVVGDSFSEGFAASEFRRHGIAYLVSPRKTVEVVLDSLAVFNTHRVRVLDSPKARRQWLNLRRDYASGGRPTIVESRKHDDLAVCTARGIAATLQLGIEPEIKPTLAFR
jgi:hypothetical protein